MINETERKAFGESSGMREADEETRWSDEEVRECDERKRSAKKRENQTKDRWSTRWRTLLYFSVQNN